MASSFRIKRMVGIDLVVPIGADEQQMPHVHLGQKILDQGRASHHPTTEDRRGRALEDVRRCKHADETPKHEAQPRLGFLRLKFGHRRLRADDMLQFGNECWS